MAESVRRAIEEMQEILNGKLEEVARLKRTINGMAVAIGDEPLYAEAEPERAAVGQRNATIRPDEFFGRSPITAAREYLDKVGVPKEASEILDALTRGGFDFDAQGWKDEKVRLRNLAISLSKNTAIFTRLPSGPFGLTKWYPDLKRQKAKAVSDEKANNKEEDHEEGGQGGGDEGAPSTTESPETTTEP